MTVTSFDGSPAPSPSPSPPSAAPGGAARSTACISVRGVNHIFQTPQGRSVVAVQEMSFEVPHGTFVSIVGPSGCGKTTVLNMVAGLVQPTRGEVDVNGRPCATPSRQVGYMFARDGLLPWRSARRNVEFGLELRGVGRRQRQHQAIDLLKRVGLHGFEHAYPKELSQGMRQRLAMARTLAIDPEVILLDEPFAALDAQTRVLLQTEFAGIWDQLGKTVLLVTHDLEEAVALSDRVLVMSGRPGRLKADITIPFGRPRNVGEIRFEDEFHHVSQRVWLALRDEIEPEIETSET